MTSRIEGHFACSLSEQTFCLYMDEKARQSLLRAGIIKKTTTPRGDLERIGIGFCRIAGGEPRLRLLPPDSPKALRTGAMQARESDEYPWWVSARSEAKSGDEHGLFSLMRRIWRQQEVEIIPREGVTPNEGIVAMASHFVPVRTAGARKAEMLGGGNIAATLADARGAENLEKALEPPPPPAPPKPEKQPDESSYGYTTLRLLSLTFRVPVTEALRVADEWTRAGYIYNREDKE